MDINKKTKTMININYIKLSFYIFIIGTLFFIFYSFIPLLNALLLSFIISYIINPAIKFFERKNIKRKFTIMVIFILLFILIVISILNLKSIVPTTDDLLNLNKKILENLNRFKIELSSKYKFVDWSSIFTILQDNISNGFGITKKIPNFLTKILGASSYFIIIPFCVFFFLLNESDIKKWFFGIIPNKYFEITYSTFREVDEIFGKYIRGTLIECLAIGIITFLGLFIIGFPLKIAIFTAVIAGISNAIPYLGPLIGGAVGVLIFLLRFIPKDSVSFIGIQPTLILVVIVFLVAQIFDNILLKPLIIGNAVNIHPLLVILGVMAGSKIYGIIGMFIAIPFIAIIKVLFETLHYKLKGYKYMDDRLISFETHELINLEEKTKEI